MKASKLLKLPVMAMREGLEQGQVIDMVVDPEKKRISHYIVRKGSRYDLLLIAAADIRGIGTGYLVVPDSTVVRRIFGDARRMEVVSRGFYFAEAQVISDAGIALGEVVDFDFDPRTSLISTLILENGAQYPASQIVGLSGTMVFVSGNPSASGSRQSRQNANEQREAEALVVAPITQTPPPASSFTRPAPSVSAQVRNAYKPEPVAPISEKPNEKDSSDEGQLVKPPNVLRRLLVGKRIVEDVTSADGVFSLPAGTVITEWHMQLAEQHEAVQQLMKHVEPS